MLQGIPHLEAKDVNLPSGNEDDLMKDIVNSQKSMLEADNKDLKNYVGSMQLTSEGGVQWVVNTVKLLQKTFFDLFYSRLMKLFTFWQVDQCLRQAPADIEQVVKDLRDLNKKIETHGI